MSAESMRITDGWLLDLQFVDDTLKTDDREQPNANGSCTNQAKNDDPQKALSIVDSCP